MCAHFRRGGLTEEDVEAAISRRAEARKAKDYAMADQVRAEMTAKGIAFMDTVDGMSWRPTTATTEGTS